MRKFRWFWGVGAAAFVSTLLAVTPSSAQQAATSQPTAARGPRKTSLEPFFLVGGAVRLDDAPLLDITSRTGVNYALGFSYVFQPISIGLSYEHASVGSESSGLGPYGFVSIDRSLDTLWAQIRMRFSGPTWGTPFLGVGAGAVFQQARVSGIALFDQGVLGGRAFGCSAQDSMNLALRISGGVDIPLNSKLGLVVDGAFDAYRLSSDIIDYCAPGAGGTNAFLVRAGIVYRYDLTEGGSRK